ncbi:hypothetical protein AB0G54_04035 [Streptomyces yokosukanensis]|uniref:hypothetical protein n=1 Tax=Streptomyces yokosukanensis TaxID=67386 RepID=UPI000AD69636|nr:hypothetical protein [Streptomyces yokosukanensis]
MSARAGERSSAARRKLSDTAAVTGSSATPVATAARAFVAALREAAERIPG